MGRTGTYDGTRCYAVDPSLPVADKIPSAPLTGFFIPYEEMLPGERGVYLDWLSEACRRTMPSLAYYGLYAYGLWYRMFFEYGLVDRKAIIDEAARMSRLHSNSKHIQSLFNDLVLYASAPMFDPNSRAVWNPLWAGSIHQAPESVIRVAMAFRQRRAVRSDEAFVYAVEKMKAIKPSKLPISMLRAAWVKEFARRHPEGIVLNPQKKVLAFPSIMPDAMTRFRVPIPAELGNMVDPRTDNAFESSVERIYTTCISQMADYGRIVSRNPSAAGTIEIVSALPKALLTTSLVGKVAGMKAALDKAIEMQGAVVAKTSRLLALMDIADDGELKPGIRKIVARALDNMDIAFEPDDRYGASKFTPDGMVVICRGQDGMAVETTGRYGSYQVAADFLLGAYGGGGREQAGLFSMVRSDGSIQGSAAIRLALYMKWVSASSAKGVSAPRKLNGLSEADKSAALDMVLSVVLASGVPDRLGIAALEKFSVKMGKPASYVHERIHRAADGDVPVSIMAAKSGGAVAIPKAHGLSGSGLDLAKIAALEAETADVSALLAGIFSEDAWDTPPDVAAAAPTGYDGLDEAHGKLLDAVAERGTVGRSDYEALAATHGLLPDGALETINEWAFDTFGAALIIDEGDLVFDENMRPELSGAGVK